MSPKHKWGLIMGGAAGFIGLVGYFLMEADYKFVLLALVTLLAAALAGYFYNKAEPAADARGGAVAGVIAGALGFAGQLLGSLVTVLVYLSQLSLNQPGVLKGTLEGLGEVYWKFFLMGIILILAAAGVGMLLQKKDIVGALFLVGMVMAFNAHFFGDWLAVTMASFGTHHIEGVTEATGIWSAVALAISLILSVVLALVFRTDRFTLLRKGLPLLGVLVALALEAYFFVHYCQIDRSVLTSNTPQYRAFIMDLSLYNSPQELIRFTAGGWVSMMINIGAGIYMALLGSGIAVIAGGWNLFAGRGQKKQVAGPAPQVVAGGE